MAWRRAPWHDFSHDFTRILNGLIFFSRSSQSYSGTIFDESCINTVALGIFGASRTFRLVIDSVLFSLFSSFENASQYGRTPATLPDYF